MIRVIIYRMGWIVAVVVALSFLLTGSSAPDWAKVYAKVEPSVRPLFMCPNGDQSNCFNCTSTAVDHDGVRVAIVAKHCLEVRLPIEVVVHNGYMYLSYFDHNGDLIEGDFPSLGELVALPADPDVPGLKLGPVPKPGDPVAVLGFGWNSGEPHIIPGIAQAYDHRMDLLAGRPGSGPLLWSTTPQLSGQSGGPVVDRQARLVSIAWFNRYQPPFERMAAGPHTAILRNFIRSLK